MDDGHAAQPEQAGRRRSLPRPPERLVRPLPEGVGPAPESSAEALTTKCGGPSEGPYAADSWKDLAPGEIRLDSAAAQTVTPGSGDPSIGTAFDPIAGTGACATAAGADQSGVATYRLPAAPAAGFTLIGSPTVVADIAAPGGESELAARLLDVAPGGTESLVARGLLRPGTGGTGFVFQLHPQAYRFEAGHVAKLELLPSDSPYARPSNNQGTITVSNLELRLPVREQPGALEGLVQTPAPKVVPPATNWRPITVAATAAKAKKKKKVEEKRRGKGGPATGSGPAGATGSSGLGTKVPPGQTGLARGGIRASKKTLVLKLQCAGTAPCAGTLSVSVGKRVLAGGGYSIPGGQTQKLSLPLSKAGRKYVARQRSTGSPKKTFPAKLAFTDAGRPSLFELTRPVHLGRG